VLLPPPPPPPAPPCPHPALRAGVGGLAEALLHPSPERRDLAAGLRLPPAPAAAPASAQAEAQLRQLSAREQQAVDLALAAREDTSEQLEALERALQEEKQQGKQRLQRLRQASSTAPLAPSGRTAHRSPRWPAGAHRLVGGDAGGAEGTAEGGEDRGAANEGELPPAASRCLPLPPASRLPIPRLPPPSPSPPASLSLACARGLASPCHPASPWPSRAGAQADAQPRAVPWLGMLACDLARCSPALTCPDPCPHASSSSPPGPPSLYVRLPPPQVQTQAHQPRPEARHRQSEQAQGRRGLR